MTIAQADDNENNYSVLKPQNEKIAVKWFTDGLRDRSIGTIFATRNYSTLKDVIRAAKDKELSTIKAESQTLYIIGKGEYEVDYHILIGVDQVITLKNTTMYIITPNPVEDVQ